MYWFPGAAATKHHKAGDSHNRNLLSRSLEIVMWRGWSFPWTTREGCSLHLLQLLLGSGLSWHAASVLPCTGSYLRPNVPLLWRPQCCIPHSLFLPVFTLPYGLKVYACHFGCIQLIISSDAHNSTVHCLHIFLTCPLIRHPDCLNSQLLQKTLELTCLFMSLNGL